MRVADAARALGVRIRTGVRVTGFELSAPARGHARPDRRRPDRHGARRRTPPGSGRPQVAAMVGGFMPSTPVDHQHIALKAVPGSRAAARHAVLPRPGQPRLRQERARRDGVRRVRDGPGRRAGRTACRGSTRPRRCPPDYERFAPLMAGAIRRFPFLADAEAIRLVCHPDAMTPDANPLLGPLPGRARVLGRGRPVAQRLRRRRRDRPGDGRLDHGRRPGRGHRAVPGVAVRRRRIAIRGFAAGLARETYADYYRLRYPVRRGRRRPAAPAVRRSTAGSRRPARCSGRRPAGSGRTTTTRAGRGAGPAATSARMAGRGRLVRAGRRGGTGGPRAGRAHRPELVRQDRRRRARARSALLQRVCANDIDRPVGAVVYTPVLDERGGMVADVTVTRLADDRSGS